MKPIKILGNEANKVDLGEKVIYEYILPTRLMSVARMVIAGRHPEKGFILENDCSFAMYVIKGDGKYTVEDEEYFVGVGDVVFVPSGNKIACEGDFEYITFDTPAYYPEQSEEVDL